MITILLVWSFVKTPVDLCGYISIFSQSYTLTHKTVVRACARPPLTPLTHAHDITTLTVKRRDTVSKQGVKIVDKRKYESGN